MFRAGPGLETVVRKLDEVKASADRAAECVIALCVVFKFARAALASK